ncbi:Protein N-terminal glutamine amidohydrolase [Orbilia oligospora]|nr:Protein N-terminal glutamine amidohydrolase [Orbilia oligospora]KAF3240824.1 Protein N-terminal glutamine amidohydrolase [Orbilia oligospora]KAF3253189.1 Protein N-terminal glutamine amidohydrolase [Orbilia oligospora]KAF3277133.1 Protein N-terminal glutamine amidohydrolase [Orbilia oligospora]
MEFLQLPPREALLYTSCYCEENIYKLIECHINSTSLKHYTVIFLSNSSKCIPVFSQKIQRSPINPAVWDYHVILAYHPNHSLEELLQQSGDQEDKEEQSFEPAITKSYIYDLDTTIQTFPCPFPTYFAQTFSPPPSSAFEDPLDRMLLQMALSRDIYSRYFRLIPASDYLEYFKSGRDHMKDKEGCWRAEPPVWDVIVGSKATGDSFEDYIDFKECESRTEAPEYEKEYLGIILGEKRLWEVFGGGMPPDVELLDLMTRTVPEEGPSKEEASASDGFSIFTEASVPSVGVSSLQEPTIPG